MDDPANTLEVRDGFKQQLRFHQLLRREYSALSRKYEILMRERTRRSFHHFGAYRLALWLLKTTSAGVALVQSDGITVSNGQWNKLGASTKGTQRWRRVAPEGSAPALFRDLRNLAITHSKMLIETGQQTSRARFHRVGSKQNIEVRFDLVSESRRNALVFVAAYDITERVRMEKELASQQQALFDRQKLQALGQMASGVAHDLGNTLFAMKLRMDVLKNDPACQAQLQNIEALDQIVADASERLDHFQDFAQHRQAGQPMPVDLGPILLQSVALASCEMNRRARTESVEQRVRLNVPRLPPVLATASELRHVFINLLLNARDAMPQGGIIHVRARSSGKFVKVSIRDEGTGIPKRHLRKIFEPFFSTKSTHGMGLGLWVSQSIVKRLGGTIAAVNVPGGGAEFTIALKKASPRAAKRAVQPPAAIGHGKILFIDDQPQTLEAIAMALGLSLVHVATSGSEALARIRKGERYDVVFCDLSMPKMSGWTVVKRLGSLAPRTAVYLLTARAWDISPGDPRLAGVEGVLQKPVGIEDLRQAISQAMDNRRKVGAPSNGAIKLPPSLDGRRPIAQKRTLDG